MSPSQKRSRPVAALGVSSVIVSIALGQDQLRAQGNQFWDPRTHRPQPIPSAQPKSYDEGYRRRNTATGVCDGPNGACCKYCLFLTTCTVLNGFQVEDRYYPTEPSISGSCDNLDSRVARLDVFGQEKTFRDTALCRKLVQDYTCLWWGSDNALWSNGCGVLAQKPPCRSYCVQVAEICANSMEWKALCADIPCPPTGTDCMPGPYEQSVPDACLLYEYNSPFQGAGSLLVNWSLVIIFGILATVLVMIAGSHI